MRDSRGQLETFPCGKLSEFCAIYIYVYDVVLCQRELECKPVSPLKRVILNRLL